ncbi:unnamed protein product [Adineta steineri]|uniref:Uncharacterized protein n=1 Tax=Adineta steineri TaxID=433720 RepID=A0A814B7H7_9BILA|nr:unnamed protein product [Adineta steineri]
MQNAPSSDNDGIDVDLNDPNTTNLDLTIHAHLNCSTVSTLDKEIVEKQKHEARLKYHFYIVRTILSQLKSSTNDDLIRSLVTTLNLIDITTDDWTILKNLRSKSKKVNKYLTVNKRKANLKLFIKKLSSRIELLRGFDDDNDTTLNESTLTDSSQLNATVISSIPAHISNANSTTPGSPLMDTAFRGLGKKKRIPKDSLLSQTSTNSIVVPPPTVPIRNEKNQTKLCITPAKKMNDENVSSSCSSPSSESENEEATSDIENENPQPQSISSVNKRARADATSTESLSPPRSSITSTSQPTFVADAIKLFLQLHQIRERAVLNHLMQNAPSSSSDNDGIDVDLNDPNTTNLDLTIHAHLNCSTVSTLDKEIVEKQKHEARLKYHFYIVRTILSQLKSSTNDDLIRSLVTTLNLIDITTDDWTILKNLRSKSKKVNKYLTVSKRKANLKLFIKKLSGRIELLRGFDDDNDTTLNESTLTDSSQLNATVISSIPAHVSNANSATPGSPLMDTAFRGLGKKKRIPKDSLLSQTSTNSIIAPPPPPTVPIRNEKNQTKLCITPAKKMNDENVSSSCSSPSSESEHEEATSDIENENPQPQSISSVNKRARADATSTESLSPPRSSITSTSRMILRSSARKQQDSSQQIPLSTPSLRQQRKHRRIDLDITPLNINNSNKKKLPPTQSSTPQINK